MKNPTINVSSPTTQNIYDNPSFFDGYSRLERSQKGLSGAPEWPVLQEMLRTACQIDSLDHGDVSEEKILRDRHVLDLGCGYGWFARWAVANGASHVKGIDVSMKMIARAQEFETTPSSTATTEKQGHASPRSTIISYEVADLETVTLNRDAYDIVYSSLAFHYIADLDRLFREIRACLRVRGDLNQGAGRGGRGGQRRRPSTLVFSVEHPLLTAPVDPAPDWLTIPEPADAGGKEKEQGTSSGSKIVWPLNSYANEGPRLTNWLGTEGVRKQHRTLQTYIGLLLNNGFNLVGLKEWPSQDDLRAGPEWQLHAHRPYFLLIAAELAPDESA